MKNLNQITILKRNDYVFTIEIETFENELSLKEEVQDENEIYVVTKVIDITTDDEREDGYSYELVELMLKSEL